jgi:hypothetical protein
MTTFLQISGIVFWLCMIAVFVDIMYTRHYKWLNGYHALTGKKFVSRYSDKPRAKKVKDNGQET